MTLPKVWLSICRSLRGVGGGTSLEARAARQLIRRNVATAEIKWQQWRPQKGAEIAIPAV
jgi:hypothetical protein